MAELLRGVHGTPGQPPFSYRELLMPRALGVGDIIAMRVYVVNGGQTAINTFNYLVTSVGGSPATDQDFADSLEPGVAPLYKAILTPQSTFHGIAVGFRNVIPLPAAAVANGHAGVGTVTGSDLPLQTCGILSYRSLLAGRAFRGRTYFPFPPAPRNDTDGTPTAAYLTSLANIAAGICVPQTVSTGGRTANLVFVLFHRKTLSTTDVSSVVLPAKWAVQHRRGSYGRFNPPPF